MQKYFGKPEKYPYWMYAVILPIVLCLLYYLSIKIVGSSLTSGIGF